MPEIPTTRLLEEDYPSIEIVGPPKCGKTTSLITLHDYLVEQKRSPHIHILDLDGDSDGARPLIDAAAVGRSGDGKGGFKDDPSKKWTEHLHVYRYFNPTGARISEHETPNRSKELYNQIREDINAFYGKINYITNKWKDDYEARPGAIIVDTGNRLQELVWDYILVTRNREMAVGTSKKDSEGKTVASGPQISDFGVLKDKCLEAIRACKGLPAIFVLTFHERLELEEANKPTEDKNLRTTGDYWYIPALTGQLAYTVGGEFSIIVYARANGDSRIWRVRPSSMEHVKSAGSRLRMDIGETIKQDFRELLKK